MFTPLTISGLVVGLVLILAGAALIVLSYTTKLFYTQTKVSTAAGDSIADGRAIIGNADVAWDDTGIVLDSTGKFLKWTSTKLYSDGGASYSYDLIKSNSTGAITTKTSSTGLKGISFDGTAALMNNRGLTTQTWASFPKYQNDMTIIYAFSCPSTKGATKPSGMSFWDHADNFSATDGGQLYDTYIDASLSSYNQVNPLGTDYFSTPFNNVKTYTSTANNISAFSYTSSTAVTTIDAYTTYFNGVRIPFKFQSSAVPFSRPVLKSVATQPKIEVGRFNGGVSYIGTMHAAYVFGRVLSATEVSSVSSYLQQKYFAPLLQYPSYVYASINSPCSLKNTLVPNAAPIVSYSISPSLPAGLTLDTTTGDISGTLAAQSRSTPYTITATNAIASSTTDIYIRMEQSNSGVMPPNITLSSNTVSVNIGGSVSSPIPVNTGGTITSFSIKPELTDPGLTFNTATGVISGISTINATTVFTITANNVGGLGNATFRLQVGTSISYPDSIHGKVGTAITPLIPMITSVDGASVDITAYACSGDLHGLTLNQTTGSISGTPTTSGVNDLTITATIGTATISATIPINIVDSKEFKNKYAYIGAGGAAVAAGVALVGTACFYGLDWNSSRIQVPTADISSNAPA